MGRPFVVAYALNVAAACALIVAAACGGASQRAAAPPSTSAQMTTTSATTTSAATTSTIAVPPVTRPVVSTTTPALHVGAFEPFSATFISSTTGFVVGGRQCNPDLVCRGMLLRTDDRGRSWTPVPMPALTVGDEGEAQLAGVRFANPRDGYLFGVDLWSTHDGGAHWEPVKALERCLRIDALEIGTGIVHVVAECANNGFTIFTGPFTHDAFSPVPLSLPYGAGPIPEVQLVVRGTRAWLVDLDRGLVAGAEYADGSWRQWAAAPCRTFTGNGSPELSVDLTGSRVAVACSQFAGPPDATYETSTDGGATFHASGPPPDDGSNALTALGDNPYDIEYTTATQGFAFVGVPPHGSRAMYLTTDAGRTWRMIAFP